MIESVKKYGLSTYAELTKVTWLTRDMLIRHTLVVLATIAVTMVVVGAIDLGFSQIIKLIILRD